MALRNFKPRSEWGKQLLTEGRAKGIALGRAMGRAHCILTVLDSRGIFVSDPARQQILSCTNLIQLDTWLRRVATAASLDELLRAQPAPPTG